MDRRVPVAVAALLVLTAGGVQLADLPIDDPSPPRVDFTEPPAQVAADSAARFSAVDYAYRLDIADDPKGPWRRFLVYHVDNTNRRYRSYGPHGRNGTSFYVNDAAVFGRTGNEDRWRVGIVPDVTYPAPSVIQPFRIDQFREANGSRIADNSSWHVIKFDALLIKHINPYEGSTTIYINKRTLLIERALVSYEVGGNQRRYVRFTVVGTGKQLDRPQGIPLTLREFVGDLIQGPLYYP